KFHEQDCVLCCQPNQHDQTDLCKYVVVKFTQNQSAVGAQNRYWHGQKYAERQRPSFVQCRQNQEDEEERHAEHHRLSAFRLLFLIGHVHPGIAEVGGKHVLCDCFHGSHCLSGTISGGRRTVDLNTSEHLEAVGVFRTRHSLDGHERSEWRHFAFGVADKEVVDLIGAISILR